MNKEEILNTFLLANIPEIITQEEFDDVKKAIFEMLKENKQLKYNWNKLKEYCKENLYFYSGLQNEDLEEDTSIQNILEKMQELEKGDSNDKNNR